MSHCLLTVFREVHTTFWQSDNFGGLAVMVASFVMWTKLLYFEPG